MVEFAEVGVKIQSVLGFFDRHRNACGARAVSVSAEGVVLVQSCVCGALQRTAFDEAETDELLELVRARPLSPTRPGDGAPLVAHP